MELMILKVLVAIAPVLIFLVVFTLLDAFKLMSRAEVLLLLTAGGVLAGLCYVLNGGVLDALPIGRSSYSRYGAPLMEEGMKAALVLLLFWRNRIGYTIDAAIVGFAIGAGFSVVENGYYLYFNQTASVGVWLVRGFGTALMHGGATAIFAAWSQYLMESRLKRREQDFRVNPLIFLPGYASAVVLHSAFNHMPDAPLIAMTVTLMVVPLTLFAIFSRSERSANRWLVNDFRTHETMLADIRSGQFAERHRIAERFRGERLTLVMEYIELHTDLVVRAEAVLMAHRNGDEVVIGQKVRDQFERLDALQKSLGRSVVIALRPYLSFSRNDLWELRELQEDARAERR
jgi:RsiW-degrading membrane proteinase PrsW (M82 family)